MKVKQNKIRILKNAAYSDDSEWALNARNNEYEDEINETIYEEMTSVSKNCLSVWKLVDIKVSTTATRGCVFDTVVLLFEREVDTFNDCEVRWDNEVILNEEEEKERRKENNDTQ